MSKKEKKKIIAYHYTNNRAYQSMQTKGIDGFLCPYDFDNFTGIIPSKRFVSLGSGINLPRKAHDGVIEGLLEPEPDSWLKNPEFPHLWYYLMHDICREKEVILLSFQLKPSDKAYIVDRAHVERELYAESDGRGKPTKERMDLAFEKYWNSRVPVFKYKGNYSAPQLAIWSGIEFQRLKVEWRKPTQEFWQTITNK